MSAATETGDMAIVDGVANVAMEDPKKDEVAQPEATKPDNDDSESPARPSTAAPKTRVCIVCEKEVGKYKCSRCFMP